MTVKVSRPDEQTRKVSWDMVRRSAKAAAGERVLQVSTKCRSIDELLSRFAPFATADSLTVPARDGIALGERLTMRVSLADQKEVFSARGEVVEVKQAGKGALDGRPVVRVRLLEMDEDSQALFLSLSRAVGRKDAPVVNDERTVVPTGVEDTEQSQAAVPPPPIQKTIIGQPKSFVTKGAPPTPPARREIPTRRPPTPAPPRSRSSVPTAQPSAPAWAPSAPPTTPLPQPERAAGSEYKLPANPLAELNIDAVKSFVDCNLYESNGFAPPPDEVTRRAEAPGGFTTEEVDDENLEVLRASALAAREELTDTPFPASAWRGRVKGWWAGAQRVVERLPAPLRRTLVQAVPFAFCTMLGWCVGFNMAGLPTPRQSTAQAPAALVPSAAVVTKPPSEERAAALGPVAAAAESPPAVQKPNPATAPPEPKEASAPAKDRPRVEPQPVASNDCVANVDVRPGDVLVKWGDQVLGRAPLSAAAVPCGPARVVFERERWETAIRQVNAKAGTPVSLLVKMNRPPSSLTLTTAPPGAVIEINGVAAGKTPRKLPLRRYETVKIDLRLEGHRSWHTEVYLKSPAQTFNAQLDPLPKPKPGKPVTLK